MNEKRYNILYVDDDEQNLYLFRVTFEDRYNIITASTAEEALSIFKKERVHIIFVDQRIPDTNGIQILEKTIKLNPNTVRILITGYSDIDVAIDAINRGSVFRYISKPWNPDEIENTIQNAIEMYNLKEKNENLITELDHQNKLLKQKVLELDFLNELNLRLREITGKEKIIQKTKEFLSDKFTAKDFIFEKIPSKNTRYTLHLTYENYNFGYLSFEINNEETNLDNTFLMAISNVVASALYLNKIYEESIERERFFILGKMASMIVHDLKGPLNTIGGFAEILSNNMEDSDRQKYSNILKGEISRLYGLVEELLAFARGENNLKLQKVRVEEHAERIKKLFNLKLKTENIKFDINIGTKREIEVDPQKMEKVLINLLDNAIENVRNYSGEKKIELEINQNGRGTIISLRNTGKEIPPHIIDKLFDPFFTYGKKGGTGLGLTICKKIVEEHNGTLSVKSSNGMTQFDIYIPLHIRSKSTDS